MLSRLTVVALLLAATVSRASSIAAMIGDAFVKLPPPAGFCELTPAYEFDGRLAAVVSAYLNGAGVRLLAMSADCDQLADARAGKRRQIDDVAQYQVDHGDMKMPPPFSVARKCSILRTVSNSPADTDIDARLASAVEKARSNETGSAGVIAEDNNGCYTATLQKVRAESGTEKILVGLRAATIIGNRAISVERTTAYQNPDTVKALLPKLEGDVAALVAANPPAAVK
jgi:hypothetical protein